MESEQKGWELAFEHGERWTCPSLRHLIRPGPGFLPMVHCFELGRNDSCLDDAEFDFWT